MIRDLAAKKECIHQDRLVYIIYNCNFTVASLMLQGRLQIISASCSQGQYTSSGAISFCTASKFNYKMEEKTAEFHGHRSLAECSPQGLQKSDTNEATWHSCTQQSRNQRRKQGSSSTSSLCMSTLWQPHIHLILFSIYRVDPPSTRGENLKYHHLVSGISHGPESLSECAVLSTTKSECDSSWSDQPVI